MVQIATSALRARAEAGMQACVRVRAVRTRAVREVDALATVQGRAQIEKEVAPARAALLLGTRILKHEVPDVE